MAIADIRREVVLAFAHLHEAQREARALLDRGEDDEKVFAAGELDFLDRQEAMIRRRLAEIDRRMSEHRTAFSGLRQEWFNLKFHIESWIAHG